MSDETEEQKKLMRQIDISCVQAFHTMDEIDAMVELEISSGCCVYLAGVQRPCGRTAAGHQRNPCGRRGKLSGRRRYDRTEEAAGKRTVGGWLPGNRHGDESYGIQKPRIFLCKRRTSGHPGAGAFGDF